MTILRTILNAIFGDREPQTVDVKAMLDKRASETHRPLRWRESIVDLLKLLDLDSSFTNRRELARELGYKGSVRDNEAMNVWLHRQVMQKLAENGGRVPDELRGD